MTVAGTLVSQETLAQRNALLERLLAMQQQAAAQVPTPTGTRAAIEGQQDAWWLDKQMKVGRAYHFKTQSLAHAPPLPGRLVLVLKL